MQKNKKIWGEEWEMKIGENYCCGKILYIKKMYKTNRYFSSNRIETIIVLKGQVLVELEDDFYSSYKTEGMYWWW